MRVCAYVCTGTHTHTHTHARTHAHKEPKQLTVFLLSASTFLGLIPMRTGQLIGAENRYFLGPGRRPMDSQVGLGASLAALLAVELVAAHPMLGHQGAPVQVVSAEGV